MVFFLFLLIGTTVKFGGKHFCYDNLSKVVILWDSAYVRRGEVYLEADSIVYERKNKKLLAFGNSVLVIGRDTLKSDSLIYNTETKRGLAFNGKTREKKGYLWGRRIYKLSDDVLHVEEGYFTTCELDTPHYVFYSPRMKILRDNMAIVSPLVLEVHRLPIIVVPFWFFPIGEGRKSGLLTPRFGFTKYDGKYIRNLSYYLVINNYMDATLGVDLIEKRGVRANIEFVYNRYRAFAGNINFTAAHEWSTGSKRWSLFGNHMGTLGRNVQLRAQANFVSDRSYLRDYSEEKTEWLQEELYSFLSITKSFKQMLFSINAEERRDLKNNTIRRTVPDFSLSLFRLEKMGIRLSSDLRGSRWTYYTPDSTGYKTSLTLTGDFSKRFKVFKVLNFSPSLNITADYSRTESEETKKGKYSFRSSMSTVLYSLSKFGLGPIERFRSTIKPLLTYSYTPANRYYGISKEEKVSLSLGNVYEAKLKSGKKLSIMTLNASTTYDLGREVDRWAPLSLNMKFLPDLPYGFRVSITYDINGRELLKYSIYNRFRFKWSAEDTLDTLKTPWSISLTHSLSWTKDGATLERLGVSISGNLTEKWRFSYSANYDMRERKLIDSSLSLERDLHCWALSFRWRSFGEYWNYDFRVWIKALPEISLKRSLFEMFLPK